MSMVDIIPTDCKIASARVTVDAPNKIGSEPLSVCCQRNGDPYTVIYALSCALVDACYKAGYDPRSYLSNLITCIYPEGEEATT